IGRSALAVHAGDLLGADVIRQGFGELHGGIGRTADQWLILARNAAYRVLVPIAADDRRPRAVRDPLAHRGGRRTVGRRLLRHIRRLLPRRVCHSAALQPGRPGVVGIGGGGRGGRRGLGRRSRGLPGSLLSPRLDVVLPRVHHPVIAFGRRAGAAAGLLPVHIDRGHGLPARIHLGFHRDLVAQVELGRFHLVAGFVELGLVGAPEVHDALVAEFHADSFLVEHLQGAAEVGQRPILVGGGRLAVPAAPAWDRDAGRVPSTGILAWIAATGIATTGIT